MARDDDRDRVGAQRAAGARGPRVAGLRGHLAVGLVAPNGIRAVPAGSRRPNGAGEREVHRQVEATPAAREVLVELAAHRVEPGRRLEDAGRDPLAEPLGTPLGAAVAVLVGRARRARGRCTRRRACRPASRPAHRRRRPAPWRRSARGGRGVGGGERRGRESRGHAVISCAKGLQPVEGVAPARRPREHAQRRGDLAVARGRRRSAAVTAARCRAAARATRRPELLVARLGTRRRRRVRQLAHRHRPARAGPVGVDRLAVRDRQQPGAQVVRAQAGTPAARPGTSPGSSRRRPGGRRRPTRKRSTSPAWASSTRWKGGRGHGGKRDRAPA